MRSHRLGSTTTLLSLVVFGLVCLVWLRRRRDALFLTVAIGGSIALDGTMKLFFARPRPPLPWAQVVPDCSFSSGHSMNSIVLFLALALLVWQIRGRPTGVVAVAVALVLSLTIGISRIYLGYRYFTDVLGGFTTSDYDATRSSDRGAIGAGRSPIDPPVWHPDATPCPVSTGRKAHSCC